MKAGVRFSQLQRSAGWHLGLAAAAGATAGAICGFTLLHGPPWAEEAAGPNADLKTTSEWHFYSGTPEAPLGNVCLFSGSANRALAAQVAKYLGMKLSKISAGKFADGETSISVLESVRGKDVFLLQPTSAPVDDNLAELLLMVSTMRRASASRIVVVIPYFGYSRQDRKLARRLVPISAAEIAKVRPLPASHDGQPHPTRTPRC